MGSPCVFLPFRFGEITNQITFNGPAQQIARLANAWIPNLFLPAPGVVIATLLFYLKLGSEPVPDFFSAENQDEQVRRVHVGLSNVLIYNDPQPSQPQFIDHIHGVEYTNIG